MTIKAQDGKTVCESVNIYVCVCVCACVRACVCVRACMLVLRRCNVMENVEITQY